ncbi:hypothetical protein [Roseinatronobacter bogoriensis]|uniref:Uncharacterized protein n=1 Tax=Roseinatronobacter bogoriensis subsp. barguzinensis TaxID=441209 RepID=A0A2K8KCF8_9RHOB|nr:hypothetical protein [Rhodobaca]ATX65603.1 hypothetical protein BG454_07010 [Rhodobaca barguzinensis]MBB4208465.1 hypothetical protein [Rhodobaca bogoriensis DSM 18756]TDW39106.1 hypothetical protein LY39_02137 [Rhodobaca barguzinensis]TDY66425.1 hypothetical protein EV660_11135 [Rhodobaca bogoriensis DSM 18756]
MTALATPALADQPVTINCAAEMAGTPFTCAQAYDGIGVTASTVEVAGFRVFVTNARLIGTDGTEAPSRWIRTGFGRSPMWRSWISRMQLAPASTARPT